VLRERAAAARSRREAARGRGWLGTLRVTMVARSQAAVASARGVARVWLAGARRVQWCKRGQGKGAALRGNHKLTRPESNTHILGFPELSRLELHTTGGKHHSQSVRVGILHHSLATRARGMAGAKPAKSRRPAIAVCASWPTARPRPLHRVRGRCRAIAASGPERMGYGRGRKACRSAAGALVAAGQPEPHGLELSERGHRRRYRRRRPKLSYISALGAFKGGPGAFKGRPGAFKRRPVAYACMSDGASPVAKRQRPSGPSPQPLGAKAGCSARCPSSGSPTAWTARRAAMGRKRAATWQSPCPPRSSPARPLRCVRCLPRGC
jgi:hypothetical protein